MIGKQTGRVSAAGLYNTPTLMERIMNRHGLLPAALAVLLTTGLYAQRADGETNIKLGKRYIDQLRGFSLRPPAGTQRLRKPSPSLLVSWVRRDAKTGAIAWTLSIQQAIEKQKDLNLKAYAKALEQKLTLEQNLRVESSKLAPTAGKPGIHIRGEIAGRGKLWQRQVWLLAEPQRFLIFSITGPAATKATLEKVMDAALGTLRVINLEDALKARKENIERGKVFLKAITDEKLKAAVDTQPQWYLFRMQGDYTGFMKVLESTSRRENRNGVEIRKWVMWKTPKAPPRLLKSVLFTTADRSLEEWKDRFQVGLIEARSGSREDGIKQNELIVCSLAETVRKPRPHWQERAKKKIVPEDIYLSKAIGDMLSRLVDLTRPAAYSFASYTSTANAFDMRTFTVVGSDSIVISGKRMEAVRVLDQAAADVEPATLWVDRKGRILRMHTEEGLQMLLSTYAGVLQRFPNAEKALAVMDRLGGR